jgi:phosphate:Na+ symporter
VESALTLTGLAGAVALLLWGVHMVQTGVQRALGPQLRRALAAALGNRARAFAAGLGVTAVLQSSTATGLMAASFAAGGFVELVPALAVMLGANVGTTLIVQLLSFDVAPVSPILILIGVMMFRRAASTRTRDLGRVAIGLGLMLLALHQLLELVTPYEDVPSLRLLLGMIATTPLVDVLVAAALTWAAHSSVAIVLLVMSLAARGVVPPEAAFALVLGANLGTAINPVLEGTGGSDPAARRLPIGNLLTRVAGCVVALALLPPASRWLVQIEPDAARAVADYHTVFNLAVALLMLPLLGPYARLLRRWLPNRVDPRDPATPVYLDPAARETPAIALAAASREALRMADVLEAMLRSAQDGLDGGNRDAIVQARRMDDTLDKLNAAIKGYLTGLDADALSPADDRRMLEVLAFATHLEHAGDVLDRNVMALAAKRLKRGLAFSAEGQAEIRAMLERLAGNLRTAAAVFMTEDPRAARQLAGEKEIFRTLETEATLAHFGRLRTGRVDTAETSALHLDLIRDLKRVNAHLVEAAAYPVLREQGELLPSRLREA